MKHLTHKKIALIVALVAAAALLAVGTFAWSDRLTQINEFSGTAADKELALHDDYEPETGGKAVYAENAGKGVMYVRVKLDEFMDLTTNTPPASIDWTTHIPGDDADHPHGKNVADCGLSNDALELFHDWFTCTLGGRKWFFPASAGGIFQDTGDYSPTGATYATLSAEDKAKVKQTAEFSHAHDPIIPMAQYMAATPQQQLDFIGWVYDTDGWAYWSRPLYAGDVTGLLLRGLDGVLAGTPWQYSQLQAFYLHDREPMEVLPYLQRFHQRPFIEYFVKLGLHKLAKYAVYGGYGSTLNMDRVNLYRAYLIGQKEYSTDWLRCQFEAQIKEPSMAVT
ncbi:MAG: hypothetical protein FWE98_07830, partial [Oscillospiraceae bacterium]|nr:hypothetical protein [Oscillospiraceae bacterium]